MPRMGGSSSDFARCYLFVDGGYVRERRKETSLDLEFDPRVPGKGNLEHGVRILGR